MDAFLPIEDNSSESRAVDMPPRLLVSVRDTKEAIDAVEGGADWIDLKEPHSGPLGAVNVDIASDVVGAVGGVRPVSAALGELADWKDSSSQQLLEVEGIGVVKLGLAGCAQQRNWPRSWKATAEAASICRKTLVAVVYADWKEVLAPSPKQVISVVPPGPGRYLLIDTYDKQLGPLLSHLTQDELSEVLQLAKQASLQTVVAGGLSTACLPQLPLELIDVIAVRGGVCDGDRTGSVRSHLVSDFRKEIHSQWSRSLCGDGASHVS